MGFLTNLFRREKPQASLPDDPPSPPDDPLIPVPIPALGVMLLHLERQKGSPLTEEEVTSARDKAVCMMLPRSKKNALDDKRGYRDIDPENVWAEWLEFRREAHSGEV